jgi:hypothetical protein
MIFQYARIRRYPQLFRSMTGLTVREFDDLADEVLPRLAQGDRDRLNQKRPQRQREIGGGRTASLSMENRLLLTIVWLRKYPNHETLGYLFGVSDSTAGRYIHQVLPVLEAAGRATMRMPDPGRKRGRTWENLLQDVPELAVVVDTFEQAVQRPENEADADRYYSGKKRRHTLKSQVVVDSYTGHIVDVADSVPGPTADMTLLKQSGIVERLPPEVGILGDLAYVGINQVHPTGLGACPRRKPRGQPRPEADIHYNTAFARLRVIVEHSLLRMRRYEAVTQMDRNHRQAHTARVAAVSLLANHQLRSRFVH